MLTDIFKTTGDRVEFTIYIRDIFYTTLLLYMYMVLHLPHYGLILERAPSGSMHRSWSDVEAKLSNISKLLVALALKLKFLIQGMLSLIFNKPYFFVHMKM